MNDDSDKRMTDDSEERRNDDSGQRKQRIFDFLVERGFHTFVGRDGTIQFKHRGRTHFINSGVQDPDYFEIICLGFYKADRYENARAMRVAHEVTCDLEGVRVCFDVRHISAGAGAHLVSPGDFRFVFDRLLRAIDRAVSEVRLRLGRRRIRTNAPGSSSLN